MEVELLDEKGNDRISTAGDATPDAPRAREIPVESRRDVWERFRREARIRGMSRRDAYEYATREADRLFPRSGDPPADPDSPPVDPPAAPELPPSSSAGGLVGLGDLPSMWPTLPPNATLPAEVSWVQANRLRVVQGGLVDLSRSLSPAPSYAALAWLETSVLFPAKWADVTVKASQDQQDDQADVRREKVALVEVQGLLAEASASV